MHHRALSARLPIQPHLLSISSAFDCCESNAKNRANSLQVVREAHEDGYTRLHLTTACYSCRTLISIRSGTGSTFLLRLTSIHQAFAVSTSGGYDDTHQIAAPTPGDIHPHRSHHFASYRFWCNVHPYKYCASTPPCAGDSQGHQHCRSRHRVVFIA